MLRSVKRRFILSILALISSSNILILARIFFKDRRSLEAYFGRGSIWFETGSLRILILGFLALKFGLKLLELNYSRHE